MKKNIWPSVVDGCVSAPPSKSEAQRAIALATMAKGQSRIVRPGHSDDVMAVIKLCRHLGADIRWQDDDLLVDGGFRAPDVSLNCGESGLAIRMFSGLAALFDKEITLTGTGSLTARPMETIEKALIRVGVHCSTHEGFLPVRVKGPLTGGSAELDGSAGSQVITGLLMAAALAPDDSFLKIKNLKSKPYADLTLEIMHAFGAAARHDAHLHFFIPGNQQYRPVVFETGGDWSGAAFMLVAGAVAGRVKVNGLNHQRSQADKRICEALEMAGAEIRMWNDTKGAVETRKRNLRAFHFDATDCPDLFPPLVALASYCDGQTAITGLHRLYSKESDRATALQDCFRRMGVSIRTEGDQMIIHGKRPGPAVVDAHGDHRIAMAAAVAALGGEGPVTIRGAQAVNKSYPTFFDDLYRITRK